MERRTYEKLLHLVRAKSQSWPPRAEERWEEAWGSKRRREHGRARRVDSGSGWEWWEAQNSDEEVEAELRRDMGAKPWPQNEVGR